MKIAKIDYINLLPFHIFLKKTLRSSIAFSAVNYNKSYPSEINKKFSTKKANLAFISSIAAKKANKTDVGIVAKSAVQSVIAIPGQFKKDIESATSNMLATILNINGTVHIGDKALKIVLTGAEHIDLAQHWNNKYSLPFVFAILCFNEHNTQAKKIALNFANSKIKIPQYILENYSKNRQISKGDILEYLKKISYKIGRKEHLAYKKFIQLSKNVKI